MGRHVNPETGATLLDHALKSDPDNPALLADRVIATPTWNDDEVRKTVGQILGRSADEAVRVGVEANRRSNYALAAEIFTKVTEKYPGSATAWAQLASTKDSLKDWG